ncbi:MAG: hypothetical protein QOF52_766 [Propionibacteriaceae bacterium]|jgi:hypothetical protein|nr:hypothetical protein [Propionibacteriaceae bacterium]
MTVPGSQLRGTVAPTAPGRLGEAIDVAAAGAYVDALGRWCAERQAELAQLDRAALQSPDSAALTHDITLSMALWKSVSDRYELLLATWDSGRVGPTERERMSSLIWGRMDSTLDASALGAGGGAATGSSLSVSLPEACRLSDALAGQLRVRLALDPSGLEIADRVRRLRAQLERIRDQVGLEVAGPRQQQAAKEQALLGRRLKEVAEKAARGGDVGGLLDPLENDASRFERDLIVGAATRREAGAKVRRARALRADLQTREAALRTLADSCVTTVFPAPNYAVPDVDALGPVPNTPVTLDAYLARLEQVSRAMNHAQQAYSKALQDRAELVSRLEAYRAKAVATGLAEHPDLLRAHEIATEELHRRPTSMPIAVQLVTLYQSYLQITPSRPGPPADPDSSTRPDSSTSES